VAQGQALAARRTGGKAPLTLDGALVAGVRGALDEIQEGLLRAARERRDAHTVRGVTRPQLVAFLEQGGGFAYGGHCGDAACEAQIKDATGATIRVLPDPEFRTPEAPARCAWCDRAATAEAVWAQAY
jgi:prolyl-tRNA synthetase